MDHFEVFGLPRRLAIDTVELQRKFYELSRLHHPDFHQAASPEEQARTLEGKAWKAMSRIVGIDLGTTNSLVAYVDEKTGLPRVIPDQEGRVLLPSVVSFTTEGVVVGEAAKRLLVRRPATTVYSVKRLM